MWGVLVPRPIFLSESYSGGVLFLGLQIGRASMSTDDLPKFRQVLYRLATEYGIEHSDGRGDMIIITDVNGIERVATINFDRVE